ncbi:ATP-binding protein [Myxococcota bacterium]|nr:ATP-binding protein [Myxococcota bacterium]
MSSRRPIARISGASGSRYRCFRDPFQVELGRLTLVYGENNSGKTALVRLPALIAESRMAGREGLVTGSSPLAGASPRATLWRGELDPADDADLVLGLELSSGTRWRWTLERRGDAGDLRVARIQIERRGGASVSLDRVGGVAGRDGENPGVFELSGERVPVALDGLMPSADGLPGGAALRNELVAALNGIRWLGAARVGPPLHATPVGGAGVIRGDGGEAKDILFSSPRLLAAVSAFYRQSTENTLSKASDSSDMARLVLSPVRSPGIAVAFPESGAGLQRMFPVIVGLEQIRLDGGLLIVEEPESHLHPRLQRALGRHVVEVLAENAQASVLIETHSEIFLLAALEAAIERLAHDVRILWIEPIEGGAAKPVPIPLDRDGRPTSATLEQAFDTMGVMRRELLGSRRRRGG